MPAELENSSAMTASNSAGEASVSSGHHATPPLPPAPKKKRNLPGMPDPDAEVISLSPKTLMTTNRFVCEICNKGFQRDQNLQLHRRGHNLPWKLRQRNGKEIRKRVYVCPEQSCVHHDPTRALGDLTGIKKHFFRKHGEKKWKCDKCSKKYAVQSDWKAHSKTCGSREYRCDCGTLFSRRESFITHRAFCDALAEESTKTHTTAVTTTNSIRDDDIENEEEEVEEGLPVLIPMQIQSPPMEKQESEEAAGELQYIAPTADGSGGRSSSTSSTNGTSLFASLFSSATATAATEVAGGASQATLFSELIGVGSMNYPEPISLCLSTNAPNSNPYQFAAAPLPSPHMSATALLQKAAQMGVSGSRSSFLRGFGLAPSSSSAHQEDSNLQWGHHHSNLDPGLGLGLAYDDGNLMMGSSSSSFFGPRPATLDLLGLGIGISPRGSATGGFSALISSISSSVAAAPSWDGEDRKPTIL